MNQLSGKVALVTGGSRGIGAATARRLARDGAAVALTYVTAADKAQAVAKQIDADGGRVLVIQADNADPGAVTAAVSQTVTHFGQIDILVNNAGIITGGPARRHDRRAGPIACGQSMCVRSSPPPRLPRGI